MPKSAKRAITVSAATPASKPVKPVAKQRKLAVSAATIDAAIAAIPVINVTETVETVTVPSVTANAVADMPRGLARDAAGIVRYATNFNQYSDRDSAYLAFFGNVCRANNHTATLRDIHAAGSDRGHPESRKRFNPNYTGSAKATDVGAVNRLCKAGYFTRSADGNTITATDKARASKAYLGT